MEEIKNGIIHSFGNKLRVRVCGIYIEDDKILLVKHHSTNASGILWAPPGGGLQFGESAEQALKREFVEETGLHIEVERFLCVHEFLAPPLHAIELFFIVYKTGGMLAKGVDPELEKDKQIITDVSWIGLEALSNMEDQSKHRIIHDLKEWGDLYRRSGFYTKQ